MIPQKKENLRNQKLEFIQEIVVNADYKKNLIILEKNQLSIILNKTYDKTRSKAHK